MFNRKIFFSGLSILSALSLMSGATFAFFTSSATSTGNVFATGTLTLQLDDNNEATPAASVTASFGDTLAPGATTSGFISMHNGGSIDIAKVKLGSVEAVTSSPDLAGKLNITSAKIDSESTCTTSPTNVTGSFSTLAALNGATISLPSSGITVGATRFLCMSFTLDPGTDNTYQGKTITETFNFEGDQNLSQ